MGHNLLSPAEIWYGDRKVVGMGLGPMSVLPGCQQQGIGSALVAEALGELNRRGIGFTVVIGHPASYQRFGFQPAEPWGIKHGFEGIPQEFLFLRYCAAPAMVAAESGRVYYHSEFGTQFVEA